MSKWGRKSKKPKGFEYLEPTLDALDEELRNRTNDSHEGKSKAESLWPVHQINWQRSRYVYDMYYKYKRITRDVYQYCLDQKLADAALIAKWKKPGYERVCSTFVINPKNFPYGTVSICRVPKQFLKDKGVVKSNFSGCMGCGSGKAGVKNIFGNKYGQRLAKIQILREKQAKLNVPEKNPEEEKEAAAAPEVVAPAHPANTVAPSTWYNEGEDIEYSDDSSTDDDADDAGEKRARKKAKHQEVTAAEAQATIDANSK